MTRRERFLGEMDAVIPWAELLARIAPYHPQAGRGRQPLGLEKMLRIYFLQQWFNLSDPQAEDAIYDSEAMRRFARVERVLEQQFVAREGAGRAHCSGSRFLLPSSVMDANRYASVAFLAVGLAASGCGDHEPAKTTALPPAAYPAAAPPAEASSVAVGCIARWTAGTMGTFQCSSTGPDKDKVKLDKDTFRLDSIWVNDARITTFGFGGGQTAPIGAKGGRYSASFNGQRGRLPESCICVPPPGGDCTPPRDGFMCIAAGHVPLGGG